MAPIPVGPNPDWVDKAKRAGCKYAPVVVGKNPGEPAIASMTEVLLTRIATCQALGLMRPPFGSVGWVSFLRAGPSHEPHLRSSHVPVIVISGGSARKIAADLDKDYSLAWHPINLRNEPLYVLVHRLDFKNYAAALGPIMSRFRNMHLIGWDGGAMTGFGAARAAALAFADSLPYRPQRILMMDQDVVQTEDTRHTSPTVLKQVTQLHDATGKPVIGYGVGFPTRSEVPRPFAATATPTAPDFNSPAQQFVSIKAPFRDRTDDGLYPVYMVAGGEDMLMGMKQNLTVRDKNIALLPGRIVKKELKGPADATNEYWSKARVDTLEALFKAEGNTVVTFEGRDMTLHELMGVFVTKGWIERHPSPDSFNVAACVIERIILRLHKEGRFPENEKGAVFNRIA